MIGQADSDGVADGGRAASEPVGSSEAADAGVSATPPALGIERARARLDQALSRLEQATIALLARKSAMEVDRRGLAETARSLQAERAELRGFILDSAEILDSLIARAEAAMVEEPEEAPFAIDEVGEAESDDGGADLGGDGPAGAPYAGAGGSIALPGLPQRRQR